MNASSYDDEYFVDREREARRSAVRVVPFLVDLLAPDSVVDVGCGTGDWLATFAEAGVAGILGVDGDYVDVQRLAIPRERFLAVDLETAAPLDGTFDLAICLEVAEHLSPGAGDRLVQLLAAAAPAVVFSAAVPGQGGRHHVNEQWLDYWIERFESAGFEAIDCLRGRYWSTVEVDFYYAQNSVLFLRPGHPALATARGHAQPMPWRVVHPQMLRRRVPEAGVGDLIRAIPAAARRTIAARSRRGR